MLSSCGEKGAERRAVVSAVAALKANGAVGVHAEVPVGSKNSIEFYNKLGFFSIPSVDLADERVILGRVL